MDPTKKSCFYIGPRCGGLIVGYTFTFLATFQLIFLTEKNLLSIFSGMKISLYDKLFMLPPMTESYSKSLFSFFFFKLFSSV